MPRCNRVSISSHFWLTILSVVPLAWCVVCLSVICVSVTFCIVAKQYVLAKKCLKKWIGNQGQKVDFFWSPAYFYFRFRLYGHRNGCFCLIFARRAQRLVLDGTNWLSSSKPCAYCRIVHPFKWTVNAYSFALCVVKTYVRNCSNLRPYDCIWTTELVSHVSRQALFITAACVLTQEDNRQSIQSD